MKSKLSICWVVLMIGCMQACGPLSGPVEPHPHIADNIIVSPESTETIKPDVIQQLVPRVVDPGKWASITVLARPARLYLALASKETWSLSFMQVELDQQNEVISIGYDDFWPTSVFNRNTYPTCPNIEMETYWTSECDTILTSVVAVRENHLVSQQSGYRSTYALGPGENLDSVMNYLSCSGLVIWGRVGHGYSGGLQLTEGQMLSEFSGISLSGKGIYANSCMSHNPPFETEVTQANADWYISGDVNLYVGPSEKVFMCWWNSAITQKDVCDAVADCETSTNYPESKAHGCSGYRRTVPAPKEPNPSPGPTPHPMPTPNPDIDPRLDNPLENGKLEALPALSQGGWLFFVIDVPAGSSLSVHTGYGSGDSDLYVKAGARPNLESFDCRSNKSGTWGSCYITGASGKIYIGVTAHLAFSEVLLKASY